MSLLSLVRHGLPGLGLGLCALAVGAQLQVAEPQTLRLSGFGTFGLVGIHAPSGWGYRRDISQPAMSGDVRADIDSRIGVQLNYSPDARFELVAQVIGLHRANHSSMGDGLEWAFAAYRPDGATTLRAGRVNIDSFLMSDHRNVGFAFPYARPPVEFYGSLPSTLDGADLTRRWNLASGLWQAKVYAGSARSGDLDQVEPYKVRDVIGAMVSREADGLLLRATYTRTRIASRPAALEPLLQGLDVAAALPFPEIAAQAADLRARLDSAGKSSSFAALGLSYERGNWLLAAEVARIGGHPTFAQRSGYVSLGHRWGTLTGYALASRIDSSGPAFTPPAWGAALTPVLGPALAQQMQAVADAATYALDKSGAHQGTVAVGLRWDLHPQIALKLQWDQVRVGSNGGMLWAKSSLDAARAHIATALVDFVF